MRGQSVSLNPANVTSAGAAGSVPFVLAKSAVPFISVSSGTIGNNGALSAITALPRTIGKAFMFFPANSIAAGVAAGWYYVQMASATAGTIFNNTYTSGAVVVPSSPTAFSTTGPGAFTGDTTEEMGPTITVPANLLGASGQLRIKSSWSVNNNANAKTIRGRYSGSGGTAFLSINIASIAWIVCETMVANAGATNSQVGHTFSLTSASGANNSAAEGTAGADTTASTSVVLSEQKATATDFMILESWSIEALSDGT